MKKHNLGAVMLCACLGLSMLCACGSAPTTEPAGQTDQAETTEDGSTSNETEEDAATVVSEGTGSKIDVSIGRFNELLTLTLAGTPHSIPFSGADLVNAGWVATDPIEMEADVLDSAFSRWSMVPCACYNEENDIYAVMLLRNQTDHTITSLDEAEIAGIRIELGDLGDSQAITFSGGMTLGNSYDSMLEAYGEPTTDGVAQAHNDVTADNPSSASVEWVFSNPEGKELELTVEVEMETETVERIELILSRY